MTTVPTGESSLLKPNERVLSTLNADGTRRWIKPRQASGRLWERRRVVAWVLIAIFVAIPHLRLNGGPLLLLDIAHREFTFFGKTFFPTDTLLLALLMISIFVSVFLMTALFGRVWCGWACPQTVYLEFLYRPIERMLDGRGKPAALSRRLGDLPKGVRTGLRVVTYLVVSFALAHVFLSYFVPWDVLTGYVVRSPAEHPVAFGVVMAVTAAMMFDFVFFREQLCLVACPYGRFQSVMLDKHSLIVGYDPRRGEPRATPKVRKAQTKGQNRARSAETISLPVLAAESGQVLKEGSASVSESLSAFGDCVDCGACVAVCPTGIDIRDGLQMECIHCAQCIDACNDVMRKVEKPEGLIRYSSQATLAGAKKRIIRPRVLVYPTILLALITAAVLVGSSKSGADVLMVRGKGSPFVELAGGEIANPARIRITNRTQEARVYHIEAEGVWARMNTALADAELGGVRVEPNKTVSDQVLLVAPRDFFAGAAGRRVVELRIVDDTGAVVKTVPYKLLAPFVPVGVGSAGGST